MNTGTVPLDEIRKALDAKYWTLEQATQVPTWLRSLLEENERLQEAVTENVAKKTAAYESIEEWQGIFQQLREELAQRTKEADHWTHRAIDLSAELAEKDKVLEWYGDEKNYYKTILDEGEKARSILSQYAKES